MGRATKGILWLMLTLGVVTAQIGYEMARYLKHCQENASVFTVTSLNNALCSKMMLETKVCECVETTGYGKTNRDNYNTSLDTVRNGDDEGAYENMALESVEDKATAM